MANSDVERKPKSLQSAKPYPDFPLTAHRMGQWCKKIRGKIHYFGSLSDPNAALAKYLRDRDELQAGRTPRGDNQGPTVKELVNRFLDVKDGLVASGELSLRTFHDYRRACESFAEFMGKNRLLSDLRSEDFEKLRKEMATGRGMVSLANGIRNVRIICAYAYNSDLIDKPFKFLKTVFKPPGKKDLRKERNGKPSRMLEASELRSVLAIGGIQLRAMILLAINCGYGQTDVSSLPLTAPDLDSEWIDFPRPKTGIERRCPLWPETVAALREAIVKRPKPKEADAGQCLFVTKYGRRFVRATTKGTYIDSVALEFTKLLSKLDLKRPGLNFYAIRHTFETVGGEAKDQIPLDFLMGHAPASDDMSAIYREQISAPRLIAVTDHVRAWLWPEGSEAAWLKAEEERRKNQAEVAQAAKPKRPSKRVLVSKV